MANTATITGRVEGLEPIIARMNHLKQGVQNRALKRAMTKIARRGAKLAKGYVKTKTGHGILKKSIGQKTYMTRNVAVAIIGPRKGFRTQIGVGRKGQPIFEDPAKIAHLVEFGHAGPKPAPPYPFMRPAWDAVKFEVRPILTQEVDAEIAKQAARGK